MHKHISHYRKENKSITEVYQEVAILFRDHHDLLVEFTHFLPDTSGATSTDDIVKMSVRDRGGIKSLPTMRDSDKIPLSVIFISLEVICDMLLDIRYSELSLVCALLQKDRTIALHSDRDLKTEHMDQDQERSLLKETKEEVRRIERKNDYMDDQKGQFLHSEKKLTLRDGDSNETSNQGREGDKFCGAIATSSTKDDKGHVQELAFVDRVKAKLNTSDYQEFLRCLNLFPKEIISQPEPQSLYLPASQIIQKKSVGNLSTTSQRLKKAQ
ncbi:Paired amphipathic helix protein Sin3-like 4 [Raphanus sativus]|nr:Paired amphipathic helix protein Sin3-like 4 [Raphanus sativus]